LGVSWPRESYFLEFAWDGDEVEEQVDSPLLAASVVEAVRDFADLVFILEADGRIRDSKVYESILPYQPSSQVIGKKIQEVLPSNPAELIVGHLSAVFQTGTAISFEFSLLAAGGPRWFDGRISLLPPSRAILLARDITAHRNADARMQQQLRQLSSLRSVDLAIASGLDLKLLLSMLLDQVTDLLRVDAVSILLLNHETNILNYSSGKGFLTNVLHPARLKVGEGFAGRVALERRMINIANLAGAIQDVQPSALVSQERFVAYYGVPLVAKGKTLGVLEIFHRAPLNPDADWLEFLNIISGQAAIAIDSAMMYRDLQRSNVELGLAYDATIDGLARALDLRGKEPEEHTRRVTDLTVRLATRMGMERQALVPLRRGAILHDIGMVAIPDGILFKAGPLTTEEWEIMHRHPDIAADLLTPITYLAPALEIPRHHHEKWDGSGYPNHLSGEHIPLAARLFALADVYDALTSDRPYRGAWTMREAASYIEDQTGKHFDPHLVPEFLKLVTGMDSNRAN
jgi:HD-GYP domain-containing protein (c-di-GMP phosphodiesterase class II)